MEYLITGSSVGCDLPAPTPKDAGYVAEAKGVAMSRTRAIALIGLVAGLSGCAQTHHHHHLAAKPTGIPAGPPAGPGASCGCATPARRPVAPVAAVVARPPTVVA